MMSQRSSLIAIFAVSWIGVNLLGLFWLAEDTQRAAGISDQSDWPGAPSSGWSLSRPADSQRGFVCKLYTDEAGRQHRYVVFVPYGLPPKEIGSRTRKDGGERPPLILFLNGYGKNGEDGISQLIDGLAPVVWEIKDSFPCVVVFPQCNTGGNWDALSDDSRRALAMLREVENEYGTDPDRVYLTGLSAGGGGVWGLAARNPRMFAAIAPVSAGFSDPAAAQRLASANLPIWNFWVGKDSPGLVSANRGMHRELLRAGASPFSSEVNGGGHYHNGWDFAFRNAAFLNWLMQQRRSDNARPQRPFVLLGGRELSRWKRHGVGEWRVEAEAEVLGKGGPSGQQTGIRVAGVEAATPRGQGNAASQGGSRPSSTALTSTYSTFLSDSRFAEFELHAEFKLSAGEGCAVLFHSAFEGAARRGLRINVLFPEKGSGGIVDLATGRPLAAASPLAQRALRPRDWNDLRLRVTKDRVEVLLNGWPWIDHRDPLVAGEGAIGLEVKPGAEVRWRDLRFRKN